jgi:hypothetical protein
MAHLVCIYIAEQIEDLTTVYTPFMMVRCIPEPASPEIASRIWRARLE